MVDNIEFPGQVQFYSFQAQGGDAVFIVLVEGDDMNYMILELVDPQGSKVDEDNSYRSRTAAIDIQLERPGWAAPVGRHLTQKGHQSVAGCQGAFTCAAGIRIVNELGLKHALLV